MLSLRYTRLFIYSLNRYTLCIFYVPDSVCSGHSAYLSEQTDMMSLLRLNSCWESDNKNKYYLQSIMVMIIVEENRAGEGSGAFAGGCRAVVHRIG